MKINEQIRKVLHKRLGIDPLPAKANEHSWRSSEWSHEFEHLCRNRMLVGGTRYGKLGDLNKPQWNRCADIKRRIKLYEQTGNLEFLVDAANLCQCEFVEGDHPNKHFKATDETEIHTQVNERRQA